MITWSEVRQLLKPKSVFKPALIGAGIGLIFISAFLFPIGEFPEFNKMWPLRPVIIVPLAGALAGIFFHVMTYMRQRNGWNKILVGAICVLVFVVSIWMGVVLGLEGTLWD